MPVISSGVPKLDKYLGGETGTCPGIPKGRLSVLYGESGSGRTSWEWQIAISALKREERVLFCDFAGSGVPYWISNSGFPKHENLFYLVGISIKDLLHFSAQELIEPFDLIILGDVTAALYRETVYRADDPQEFLRENLSSRWDKPLETLLRSQLFGDATIVADFSIRDQRNIGSHFNTLSSCWVRHSSLNLLLRKDYIRRKIEQSTPIYSVEIHSSCYEEKENLPEKGFPFEIKPEKGIVPKRTRSRLGGSK